MRWPPRRWRAGRAMLLAFAIVLVASDMARANVEISNFGPLLCPLDEAGRADVQAAEHVAREWPTLNVHSRPVASFALVPTELRGEQGRSSAGAWLRLELAPAHRTSGSSPRDRALAWARWMVTQRYTVRASTPANVPFYLDLDILGPRDMLQASSQEPGAIFVPSVAGEADAAGSGFTVSAHHPGQAAGRADSVSPDEDSQSSSPAPAPAPAVNGYYAAHHAHENAQRLARTDTGARAGLPEAPCTVVYAHIVPHSPAVSIPPRRCGPRSWWQQWFDQLAWDASRPCESGFISSLPPGLRPETFAGAPVTVALDQLDAGLLPHAVLGMLGVLLASLLFARMLYPLIHRPLTRLSRDVLAEETRMAAPTQ